VRWQLSSLRRAVKWLGTLSLSGVWRHLRRAGLARKRARLYLRSPDAHYSEKLAEVVRLLELAAASDGRVVVVFADEFTFYRQPTLAFAIARARRDVQPKAYLSHRSNSRGRIAAAINALSGQLSYRLTSRCSVNQLLKFYEQLRLDYPKAEVIYLVEDNWAVHFHPTVLAALVEQVTRFALKVPASWENLQAKPWRRDKLPIQIVPLPTYASWCNPIEKLWRWLNQEVLHLHRKAEQWDELKEAIKNFLDRFCVASAELLKYIGLTENSKCYGAALSLLREKPS
jgi:transposase